MWENIIKAIGIKPEQIQQVADLAARGQKDIDDIKILLADLVDEHKKTNYYLHRAEQRAIKARQTNIA